jgi:hypothetical protein
MNPQKYSSRKFILVVAVSIGVGVLLWFGKIGPDHFERILIWALGFYLTANVGEAYVQMTAKKE